MVPSASLQLAQSSRFTPDHAAGGVGRVQTQRLHAISEELDALLSETPNPRRLTDAPVASV